MPGPKRFMKQALGWQIGLLSFQVNVSRPLVMALHELQILESALRVNKQSEESDGLNGKIV